jgi:hypothetical protein
MEERLAERVGESPTSQLLFIINDIVLSDHGGV